MVNPVALLGAAPVFIPAPGLVAGPHSRRDRARFLDVSDGQRSRRRDAAHLQREASGRAVRRALVASLGMTVIWLQQRDTTAVMPVETSEAVPSPPPAPIKNNRSAPAGTAAHRQGQSRRLRRPVPSPRRTPVVQTPPPAPPSPPPVVEEPAPPEPSVEPPPIPPTPPPPPPLQWPQWEFPQWPPPPPPGGGSLTGPPNLVIDPPRVPSRDTLPQP